MKIFIWPILIVAALSACGPQVVSPLSGERADLDKTLVAVGKALRSADQAAREARAQGESSTGLIPAEVTVAFNLETKTTKGGGVDLKVLPEPATTIGANWKGEVVSTGANNITIKYSNVLLVGKDGILTEVDKAKKALDFVNENITTQGNGPPDR